MNETDLLLSQEVAWALMNQAQEARRLEHPEYRYRPSELTALLEQAKGQVN